MTQGPIVSDHSINWMTTVCPSGMMMAEPLPLLALHLQRPTD